MPQTIEGPFKNQLANIRRTRHLEQKQVARLLGHNGIQQISRYENGVKTPNLKTALKLAQIYGIPVRIMLNGYFEACRNEVRRQEERLSGTRARNTTENEEFDGLDYCTYEQKLSSDKMDPHDLVKVRRHSTYLVRKTAEKLGHI